MESEMKVYYRRMGRPAYPCLYPHEVEVSLEEQITGPADDDWNEATFDPQDHITLDLVGGATEAWDIADDLTIEGAILDYLGISHTAPIGWIAYGTDYLDDTGRTESYEALCNAVEYRFGAAAGRAQRIALRSVLSDAYLERHRLLPCGDPDLEPEEEEEDD